MTTDLMPTHPQTLPVTVEQYRLLVAQGAFANTCGQVELIYGKIVQMDPQGPQHSDPTDELEDWSHRHAGKAFRIRIEKPIEIIGLHSTPEPDVAWVTRRRYADRHPTPADIYLLIEVCLTSKPFDRGEKRQLYAEAGIVEYWIVDVAEQTIEVMTQPEGLVYRQIALYKIGERVAPQCLPTAYLAIAQLFSDDVD